MTTSTPTQVPLITPLADSPAAGICADSTEELVTVILLPDMPSPRCASVLPEQRLRVVNQSQVNWKVSLAHFSGQVGPGEAFSIDTPFGEYLAPGVHRLTASIIPPDSSTLPSSVEIWLVTKTPTGALTEPPTLSSRDTTPMPVNTPAAAASPSPTHVPLAQFTPSVPIFDQPGELYQTLFSLPLGGDGVEYFGAGVPEMQVSGPNAIALLDQDTFAIADPVANRIRLYDFDGNLMDSLHLSKLNIHIITDMLAAQGTLLVLEVGFGPMPETNHIYRLADTGAFLNSYTLPPWATMENGLTGMHAGGAGEIYVLMKGGEETYQVVDARGAFLPTRVEGFRDKDQIYQARGPRGQAGEIRFQTELTHGFGGLHFLGKLPDGSFFIVREDVVDDQVIRVDQTVHYLSPSGEQLGVARLPIADSYYPVTRPLALAPDGSVYALLPRPGGVDILRLNFYDQLDALLPGAMHPWVGAGEPPSP